MMLAQGDGGGALLVVLLIGLALYLVPTLVAVLRKVPNVGSVAVINILLGWSVVGWVVAMAMAARSRPAASQHAPYPTR